jgi:alpha-glucosidase
LFHLEYGSTATPAQGAIPISPQLMKQAFDGPTRTSTSASSIETPTHRLVVTPATLCVAFFEGTRLNAKVCPKLDSSGVGLSVTKEGTTHAYGLGEQFRKPGEPNGDWLGDVRTAKIPEGNSLEGYMGGGVANAQFPILYALGSGLTGYALFVDQTPRITWDFRNDPWQIASSGSTLRFFLIGGSSLPALRTKFMELTGKPLVPPRTAFGFWLSEFGYRSWEEIEDKLHTLRENKFPIDGFVLDAYWYGQFNSDASSVKNSFGNLWFYDGFFPHPEEYVHSLQSRGLGLMLHETPWVNDWTQAFKDLTARGGLIRKCENCGYQILTGYLGRVGMLDYTNENVASYWHQSRRKRLSDAGIHFHWTDFSELDGHSDPNEWYSGAWPLGHSSVENHNVFALKWSESISRGYEAEGPTGPRHFILSRSGAPGIQRHGSAMWSGDIGSNMDSLAAHLNVQMQMSLSGLDYFGSDTGGYQHSAVVGDLGDVYTKWFAHSAAFDVPLRPHTNNWNHTQNTAPDRIGDRASNLANLRTRYELSPYYYSLAYEAHLTGAPVVPPLVYYFQDDPQVRRLADEKMIGKWILVGAAPKNGPVSRSLYLPKGDWIDYRTHQLYKSEGQAFDFDFNRGGIFQLPYLVRRGAILPVLWVDDRTLNVMGDRADGSRIDDLNLTVFPCEHPSNFTVYEDDGVSRAYLSGAYAHTRIEQMILGNQVHIGVMGTEGAYDRAPSARQTVARVVLPGARPTHVFLNDSELPRFDTRDGFEKAQAGWFAGDSSTLIIRSGLLPVTGPKKFRITLQ